MMDDNKITPDKCLNCNQGKNCKDSSASWIFFIIGIIATIAIRAVTILAYQNPIHGKIAWYIGVGGFIIFFIYKFRVNQSRARLIRQKGLLKKVSDQQGLSSEDYNIIEAILCSLASSKEKINYLFIFILSAVAILLAIYIDLF